MRGSACWILIGAGLLTVPANAHPGHEVQGQDPVLFVSALADLQNEVEIEVRGRFRYITANGVPEHKTGRFPNRGNPNEIREQQHRYRISAKPQEANKTTTTYGQPFGIALNGVPFDPGTAEVWTKNGRSHARGAAHGGDNTWNYDALSGKINLGIDSSNAHVQPSGAYHYHGIPVGLVARLSKSSKPQMVLVGYAADGFPIYSEYAYSQAGDASSKVRKMTPSYRLKEGDRPGGDDAPGGEYDGTFIQDFEYVEGLGDLDECNGRSGVTPEYPNGTYYYVLTEAFPMIPRAFRGTPDRSFERRRSIIGGGGLGGGGIGGGAPPRRDRPPPPGDRPPPPRR